MSGLPRPSAFCESKREASGIGKFHHNARHLSEGLTSLKIEQMPLRKEPARPIGHAGPELPERTALMDYAELQLRRLCASRELNWDAMTEDEREAFVDTLIHEDRKCP